MKSLALVLLLILGFNFAFALSEADKAYLEKQKASIARERAEGEKKKRAVIQEGRAWIEKEKQRMGMLRKREVPLFANTNLVLTSQAKAANPLASRSKASFQKELGVCLYKEAVLRKSRDSTCTTEGKHLCSFEVECSHDFETGKENSVFATGVCLVDKKCPADPMDCIAKQSFEKLGMGTDVIEKSASSSSINDSTSQGGAR